MEKLANFCLTADEGHVQLFDQDMGTASEAEKEATLKRVGMASA